MVIRMRHTRSHTKNRRSHHALEMPALSTCSHCKAMHRSHHMCLECGYYKGRQIMDLESKKAKREERIRAKEERIRAETSAVEPETTELKEDIPTEDESKQASKERKTDTKPEKKVE